MFKHKKIILLLIVIGFIVYFRAFFNGFVWDDEEIIVKNPQIHSLFYLPDIFSGSTFYSGGAGKLAGLYYKPLMMTVFAALYSLVGPNAGVYHFVQVVLHIVNSVLLFYILRRFIKSNTIVWVLALIFLVHPINSEAVVYISDLQDILFFFFGSLAMLVNSPIAASALIFFSLLSKETGGVMMLLVLLMYLFYRWKDIKLYIISTSIALGLYAYLRFVVAGIFFNKHGLTPITTMPFINRLMNIPAIIYYYLKTFFWPATLATNQQWAIRAISWPDFWLPLIIDVIFFIILIALGLVVWVKNKTLFKAYVFFFLWFILALGFHLQLFPLDLTVSDRWFYLPMAGLLGMMGVATLVAFRSGALQISPFWRIRPIKIIFLSFAGLALIALTARTIIRTFDWQNGLTLYGHDIKYSRGAFDLENNYGVELFRIGKFDEAAVHFQKSIDLSPNWWTSYNNLGAYYERKGDLARAEELYKKSIKNGNYYLAYENLAWILLKEKKFNEDITFLEGAVRILPQNLQLLTALAISQYEIGNKEKAVSVASYLMELSPPEEAQKILGKILAGEPLNLGN